MQCAEPPDKVAGVHANNLVPRHEFRQDIQCDSIVPIVESRHQHHAVGNVEVRVAGRQAFAGHDDPTRIRERDYPKGPDLRIARGQLEPAQVVDRLQVIVVARVVLDGYDDRVRRDEPRDVVHVTVRVIARTAVAEPDGPADAQPVREDPFVILHATSQDS